MYSESFRTGREMVVDPPERTGPSWERTESASFVGRLFGTMFGALLNPTRFFKQMRRADGYMGPLVYGMILGSFSTIVQIGWNVLLISFGDAVLETSPTPQVFTPSPGLYGLMAILSPILVTIVAFLWSGIIHVVLLVVGGASHGFQTSFRVVCYARSAGIWHLIPVFGPLIGSVWYAVLLVVGFAEAHETSLGKALAAVLIPLLVWTAVIVLVAVALFMTSHPFL
jgi:hypothetical protein